MMTYNFDRIFKAKGIDKPYTFLVNAGFSDSFATKVKNNKVHRLTLDQIERFCYTLQCTPNDIFDWAPDDKFPTGKDHPLHSVTKTGKIIDLKKTISAIPLDKVNEIEKLINENINPEEESDSLP